MMKRISLSLLCISILLLTFSTMYSAAQLMQLNTIQHALLSQTPKESDKEMEESKLKKADQKKMMEMKEKKDYKDKNAIRILNPSDFYKSQENRIYSGPQPGEKLPPLMVTHLYGKEGKQYRDKAFDITAGIGEKPLILFLQDNNIASIKGMDENVDALSRINQHLKGKSILNKTEKSDQELQISIVFLLGDNDTLPDWSDQFLKDLESDNIKVSKSTDGREGPGSYGLNRNVSQTILIAKDGKVLHNFAFTQPSFYTDPHVLGGVAQAIDVEPTVLENLLNKQREVKKKEELQKYQEKVTDLNEKLDALKKRYIVLSYKAIREAVSKERISKDAAAEKLRKLGITWQEGEALLKDNKEIDPKQDRDLSPEQRIRREGDTRESPEARMQREGTRDRDRERDPSPEERIRRDGDKRESPEGRRMEREGNRDREGSLSPEALIKRFDKDGNGKLNEAESLAARRAMSNREGNNRQQRRKVEVKNPDEFKQNREQTIFSGPQPEEKLPSLTAIAINGDAKGKTIDFITKADKKPLVLIFQDEKPLGLRGLVGFTRLIAQINKMAKLQISVHVLFLGDSPDTLTQQANKIVPHVPKNVLLGISPDGREGPGNYGLNRNVAQTILTVKDGKVLHNFALAQPMLSPDPYVLGGIAELIGQKPATVQKMLNAESSIIEINNPAKGEKTGRMLLNGTVVQYDQLLTILRNLPTEDESMVIIHTERNVLHEQIVKVMDIAKEAGIDNIGFGIKDAENKRMEGDSEEKQ